MVPSKLIFTKIFLSLFVILVVVSCRKDPPIPDTELPIPYCECCDLVDAPDVITFGDTSMMRMQYLNDTVSYWYYQDTILIDVENDGENDFMISSYCNTGMGGALYWAYGWIESLNDSSFISSSYNTDTIYYYETTTYYGSSPVNEVFNSIKSCVPLTCCDSIYSISNKLNYYSYGNQISTSQYWQKEYHYFRRTSLTVTDMDGVLVNDTLHYNEQTSNPTCSNMPTGGVSYIGIKKISCGEEKLGWIKFNIAGGTTTTVIEAAIQK